jgi:fructose-1,6-bisphosphatase/inositol monophosphatase family enzyme
MGHLDTGYASASHHWDESAGTHLAYEMGNIGMAWNCIALDMHTTLHGLLHGDLGF